MGIETLAENAIKHLNKHDIRRISQRPETSQTDYIVMTYLSMTQIIL